MEAALAKEDSDNPLIKRIPIKDRNGKVIGHKEVVSFRGLLNLIQKDRVSSIKTTLIQTPNEQNGDTAIVHAVVVTTRGTFTGIGDASPANVTRKLAPHIIRMAETRSVARASRLATNIGVVALEELGEDIADDLTYESTIHQPPEGGGNDRVQTRPPERRESPTSGYRSSDNARVSDAQRRFVFRLLAERGVEGEQARDWLHKELEVDTLTDASRQDVSALIDRLKAGDGLNGGAAAGAE